MEQSEQLKDLLLVAFAGGREDPRVLLHTVVPVTH